jgi:hypothetical protein
MWSALVQIWRRVVDLILLTRTPLGGFMNRHIKRAAAQPPPEVVEPVRHVNDAKDAWLEWVQRKAPHLYAQWHLPENRCREHAFDASTRPDERVGSKHYFAYDNENPPCTASDSRQVSQQNRTMPMQLEGICDEFPPPMASETTPKKPASYTWNKRREAPTLSTHDILHAADSSDAQELKGDRTPLNIDPHELSSSSRQCLEIDFALSKSLLNQLDPKRKFAPSGSANDSYATQEDFPGQFAPALPQPPTLSKHASGRRYLRAWTRYTASGTTRPCSHSPELSVDRAMPNAKNSALKDDQLRPWRMEHNAQGCLEQASTQQSRAHTDIPCGERDPWPALLPARSASSVRHPVWADAEEHQRFAREQRGM